MQFKVPQNVQREDTIVGPLTLKQLIILGFGGGVAYTLYVSLAKTYFIEIWLPPVAIVIVITAAFAFLKVHALPFHIFLMNYIEYHLLPRKRIWIQGADTIHIKNMEKMKKKAIEATNTKQLKDIGSITNVLDAYTTTLTKLSNKK